MSSFGVLLKQLRLRAGLTQETLAGRADLSKRSIQHLERGLGQPHRETSRRLAEALSLSVDQRAEFEALAAPSPRRPRRRFMDPRPGRGEEPSGGHATGRDPVGGSLGPSYPDAGGGSSSERRHVTVVFADIVEPARYFQALGPGEAVRLLDTVLTAMRSAVEQFHGTVTRIDHEGMTVLFGTVAEVENAALYACRAALTMQQAVRHLAEERVGQHTVIPQVRFGLASGEVVVRTVNAALSTDYTAAGLPLHIASWIARLSSPSGIWLSAETMRMVEGHMQVRALAPIGTSGTEHSITAYELVDLCTADAPFTFVGRIALPAAT